MVLSEALKLDNAGFYGTLLVMGTTFIYALCEPGTRTVRYIGKAVNPKRRLKAHRYRSIKDKTHLGNWLRLLNSQGKGPEMVVLREVPGDGSEAEMRYIRLARGCQIDLVNSTDGGDGVTMTPEIREKISAANTGRPKPLGAKLAISGDKHPYFGKRRPAEVCKKISDSKKGVAQTPEQVAANREARLKEVDQLFTRTGPRSINFGRKRVGASSEFHGVSRDRSRNSWQAAIKVGGKNLNLGRFKNELDAARAYDAAATKFYGARAILNFPL